MNSRELVKQLQDMGCKHLGILSVDDDVILAQNSSRNREPADIKAQAEKVINYLSKAPNGTYVIYGKTSPQSKPTKFIYVKGEDAPAKAAPLADAAHSRGSSESENVLSYAQALKMQQEIAELRAENARLKDLVDSLEADMDAMESDAAEAPQLAESPAMGALGQLAAVLPALVDKWFENQKENREIEKAKMYQAHQQRQAQQPQYQSNGKSNEYDSF